MYYFPDKLQKQCLRLKKLIMKCFHRVNVTKLHNSDAYLGVISENLARRTTMLGFTETRK